MILDIRSCYLYFNINISADPPKTHSLPFSSHSPTTPATDDIKSQRFISVTPLQYQDLNSGALDQRWIALRIPYKPAGYRSIYSFKSVGSSWSTTNVCYGCLGCWHTMFLWSVSHLQIAKSYGWNWYILFLRDKIPSSQDSYCLWCSIRWIRLRLWGLRGGGRGGGLHGCETLVMIVKWNCVYLVWKKRIVSGFSKEE